MTQHLTVAEKASQDREQLVKAEELLRQLKIHARFILRPEYALAVDVGWVLVKKKLSEMSE